MKSSITDDTKKLIIMKIIKINLNNNNKFSNLLYFLNNIHYIDTFLQLLFICLKKIKWYKFN